MPVTTPRDNRILAGLPSDDYERISRALEFAPLSLRQLITEAHAPLRHVYFPTSGLISMLREMEDGRQVEVGSVGREGIAGARALLGDRRSLFHFIAQIPGEAYRMTYEDFLRECDAVGPFRERVLRFLNALVCQLSQWVACNILHTVEQRCCRWLIMVRDRTGSDQFPLTHEFLAQMLGVRRASVTEVARTLQKAGLIRYRRGEMTILDPQGLEAAACECHRQVKEEVDRLLD
jgi:CRP-like cAMP-binding protein